MNCVFDSMQRNMIRCCIRLSLNYASAMFVESIDSDAILAVLKIQLALVTWLFTWNMYSAYNVSRETLYKKEPRRWFLHSLDSFRGPLPSPFRLELSPFRYRHRSGTGAVPVQAFKTNLSGQRLILLLHQRCLRRHPRFSRINSRGLLNLSNNHQASLARIIGKWKGNYLIRFTAQLLDCKLGFG